MLHPLWASSEPPVRRRGGWRQQLQAMAAEAAAEPTSISRLAAGMLLEWADGGLSASRLQQHCSNAREDGLGHPMVQRLANMGTNQNAHNGLMRLLGSCSIPGLITAVDSEQITHMVLPSTWLRLLHKWPAQFSVRLGANKASVRTFWTEFLAREHTRAWAARHFFLSGKGVDQLENVVPLTVFTDAGPFSLAKSCVVICFSSLLGQGPETLTKFICGSCVKEQSQVDEGAWGRLIMDMIQLTTGVVDGSPVAEDADGVPWRFVLLFCKSDEETRCNEFGMTHYNGAQEICSECLANRTDRPFTDLRAAAAWRESEVQTWEMYKARVRRPLHPLLSSPFCSDRAFMVLDLMHVADCKGVAALVLGSIVSMLLADARLGPNKDARLQLINNGLKTYYDRHPGTQRLPPLRHSNVYGDGWANLHGPQFKAANTRAAVPAFSSLCHRWFVRGTPEDTSVLMVIDALQEFYQVVYHEPMFVSDEGVARLRAACVQLGTEYQRLREFSRAADRQDWHITPKVHKLLHYPFLATIINPKATQNYGEESHIGTITTTWKRSISGRYTRNVQANVLTKRIVALLLRFELSLNH